MAEITVPIQVNLPEYWKEQIIERLCNDPESEWVQVVRCRDCKHHRMLECPFGITVFDAPKDDEFCSRAERKENGVTR